MFGRAVHWLLDGVVVFFALYAFLFVPLGRATAYEHARAILDTKAAQNAARDLFAAGARVAKKLLADRDDSAKVHGRPTLPKLRDPHPPQMRLARTSLPPRTDTADASVPY